jgi:hypothetical protein
MPQAKFNSCDYCGKKDCDGCELKYSDEKFLADVKVKYVEMEIEWIINAKEIQ